MSVYVKSLILFFLSVNGFAENLIFGDSHACGALGIHLQESLRARLRCRVGSGPEFWIDKIKGHYDTVVVVLGTNTLLQNSYKRYDLLTSQIKAARCIFVGPPHFQRPDLNEKLNLFYKTVPEYLNKCVIFDSRPATSADVTLDGIHRKTSEAIRWAFAVENFLEELNCEFYFNVPI